MTTDATTHVESVKDVGDATGVGDVTPDVGLVIGGEVVAGGWGTYLVTNPARPAEVVVDAPASGHIVGQLAAPQAINDLVKVGLIRSQTDWMLEILSDPRQTGLIAVCTPEEMPVSETLELDRRVREETTVRMSAVVVNRVLPELFGQREEEIFEQLRGPDTEGVLSERAGGNVAPVLEAARLAVTMRRTRSAHLQRLRAGLPEDIPVLLLPYLFARSFGVRTTRQVAHALGEELGL